MTILQRNSLVLCNCVTKHPHFGSGETALPFLLLAQACLHSGVAVSHFVPFEGQNGHNANHQGQVNQVQGNMEASQQRRDADGRDAPRPGQEQKEGVLEGAEDKSREGQDESEQRGCRPGVQGQRRQEERHGCLTQGCGLIKKRKFKVDMGYDHDDQKEF